MGEGGPCPPPTPAALQSAPTPSPVPFPPLSLPLLRPWGAGAGRATLGTCPLLQVLLSPGLPVSLQGREREGADGPGGHGTPRLLPG